MNKIVLSILALSTASVANAQVTIKNTDLMPLDSTITTYVDTVPANAPNVVGTAGVDKMWNFSDAKKQGDYEYNAKLPQNTLVPSFSIIANYAVERISTTDTLINYYDNLPDKLVNKARRFSNTLAGTRSAFATTYSPPQNKYKFPMQLGATNNLALVDSMVEVVELSAASLGPTASFILDSVRLVFTTKASYNVDALGKLKTPEDTNLSVIRLKIYSETKVHIDLKGTPGNFLGLPTTFESAPQSLLDQLPTGRIANDTLLKTFGYEFWSNGSYLPVVKVSTLSATDDTARVVEWQKHHSTLRALSVKTLLNNVSVKMYPNPTANLVYITTTTNVSNAIITDVAGRTIAQLPVINNTIDVSTLNNNNYIITLINTANVAIANATIVVNK